MAKYYNHISIKIKDFCIGFFGFLGITIILYLFGIQMEELWDRISHTDIAFAIAFPAIYVSISINIIGIIFFFVKKRRYISVGIISALLLFAITVTGILLNFL